MLTTGFWVSQSFTPWLASCCSITTCGDTVKWPLLSGTSEKKQGGGGTNAVHTHTQPLPVDVRTETTKKGKNKETLQLTQACDKGRHGPLHRQVLYSALYSLSHKESLKLKTGWVNSCLHMQVAHYTRKVRLLLSFHWDLLDGSLHWKARPTQGGRLNNYRAVMWVHTNQLCAGHWGKRILIECYKSNNRNPLRNAMGWLDSSGGGCLEPNCKANSATRLSEFGSLREFWTAFFTTLKRDQQGKTTKMSLSHPHYQDHIHISTRSSIWFGEP